MAVCKEEGCHKDAAKNRRYCHSCRMEKFKNSNPEKYAYFILRQNAKRRHKVFSFSSSTFYYFVKSMTTFSAKALLNKACILIGLTNI